MADEFNPGPNWWDRTAAPSSSSSSSSSSSVLNNSLGTFGGWNPEMADIKARSPMDSISSSSSSSVSAPDLHMMGLGLSSQAMDWNQAFMRGDHKSKTSFKSMLEEHNLNASNPNYHQEMMGFKHQSSSQFSPCSSDSSIINNMDSTSLYGSPSTILQGLLGTENQTYENRSISYQYGMNNNDPLLPNSWSKVPQFLKNSPPKNGQLHFSNNAPFWNPSAATTAPMVDHRPPGFFPSFPTPNFDEKPKNNIYEVKKNGNETSSKRPRNEMPSLPAFKVRKEKMGDRISALQQLVSPFGKTDTASVLSEVIEYIKFLHEQINVLSTPYKKTRATAQQQQQQNCEKSKDFEGFKHDLRSRGLCLVPVSSTFPMTHESTVDFWTPTFGGTFR
ncbi:transcription factor bHLH123-like [Gossypium arboreum]|uniref:BHLH domain-containing protein n=1 Tax=Gossypium arboreum TaxID=29729 RepID=A0ABR0Q5F8_GOSAR|nr:transcription factor bHLH123-like [Gossypium arboreum]KAK5834274.1 hypothetical protein PVK06_018151 [Gossypium arboreum]